MCLCLCSGLWVVVKEGICCLNKKKCVIKTWKKGQVKEQKDYLSVFENKYLHVHEFKHQLFLFKNLLVSLGYSQ